MKFLFTCGGTAGHINPAIALADEIRRIIPNAKVLFIGSGRRLENTLIPQSGYDIENIIISGFERKLTPKNIVRNVKTLRNAVAAETQCRKIIDRFKPNAVIGTGGYVCYPVLKAAARLRIPTLIHESNAVPGLTTKLLAGKVDKILVALPNVSDQYNHPEKVIFMGTPVRAGFAPQNKSDARLLLGIDDRPLVVSFWGSLGAEKMNEIIAEFISMDIESKLFNHVHATGGSDSVTNTLVSRIMEKSTGKVIPQWIDIRTYIYNMPTVMAAADLVLCRAGASTIAELTALGKPAVLIPSPNVTNNHQEKNAYQLEKTGGVVVIEEQACTPLLLYETVANLLKNQFKLTQMSGAIKKAGVPDSANKIANLIISMC